MPMARIPLGRLALAVAAAGLLSGLFLAFHYAPTLESARDSVSHLQERVALGAFLRSFHHWAGNFAIALALLHGIGVFLRSEHKAPRRALWALGVGIAAVLVAFAYTGYLLVGDERAATGLQVLEGVVASTPVAGPALRRVVLGGDVLSSATMTRIYAIHAHVLPLALVALGTLFARMCRRVPPGDADPARFPAVGSLVLLALLVACAVAWPPALGPKADPAAGGSADARPEWFFLWVNLLLHKVPAGTFLIAGLLPLALGAFLLGLPWWFRGRRRGGVETAAVLGAAAAVAGLTLYSAATAPAPAAHEEPARPAQVARTEEVAQEVIRRQCKTCHVIDGDPTGGSTGPPLNRNEFAGLYTRAYFRKKVGDPVAFWADTTMIYKPRTWRPSPEQLDALESWFFGARR